MLKQRPRKNEAAARRRLSSWILALGVILAGALLGGGTVLALARHAETNKNVLTGHTSGVTSVAWSPDGQHLASSSDDQTVRLWDPVSGQSTVLRGHTAAVKNLAWIPNGTKLATASDDGTIRVWNMLDGKLLVAFPGPVDGVNSVAWSPDGKELCGGTWSGTHIWDLVTQKPLATLPGRVTAVAWSPDGSRLATVENPRGVQIWNVTSQQGTFLSNIHDGSTGSAGSAGSDTDAAIPVMAIAWSPGGSRLAAGLSDGSIGLWNLQGGQPDLILRGHTATVTSVAWSPDGTKLASGSEDHTVRIWNVASGETIAIFRGHDDQVTGVAWSPNGVRLASSSLDKTVRLWELGQR